MRRTTTVATVCAAVAAMALGGCGSPVRWQSSLVTHNAATTNSGNGASTAPVLSADGTKVAFVSEARNFGLPDTNGVSDVFVKDLTTGTITLASINRTATNSGNDASMSPVFSPDGTKVAFRSSATNLQPVPVSDFLNGRHIYVRDLTAGTTALVTVEITGTGGFGDINSVPVTGFVFSPDGTKLAFDSGKGDLVAGDVVTISSVDLFVRDLTAGTTTLVSGDVTGTGVGTGSSQRPRFGPDGTTVAFDSSASNLVAGDTNGVQDVFVRDLDTATTSIVVAGANGASVNAELSPDGTKVVFESTASNLGAVDTNGVTDVYVSDLGSGAAALVSTRLDGGSSGNGESTDPAFSPDGAQVTFTSTASNLVGTDTNDESDVFVRTLGAGTTSLVSVRAGGPDSGFAGSRQPSFAGNGKVLFESLAWNLGPNDTNNDWDLYLRDLSAGTTSLVSAKADGADSGDEASITGSLVAGRVAYQSRATDLGASDTNGTWDIYIAAPFTEPPPPSTTTTVRPGTTMTVPPPTNPTTTEPPPTTTEPPPTTDPPPTEPPLTELPLPTTIDPGA